jgi:serine/threonine protein kinase/dipeptidyl aminopeptidase/acylaminoacyl peptidase
MIGQTVSHYRIVEKLGEGAMGVVYLAEDTHLGRQVAIKFLSDSEHQTYRARFLREARAVSTLSHRNIAVVHDYGETPEGQPFIVMEYIKGETLSDLLHSSSLTIIQSLEIVEAVAGALRVAHGRGIIHRDIKPSNVIVDKDGEVKVLDFGLVKQLQDENAPSGGPDANTLLARTNSNVIVGTPLYLSPEQAMGADVDARSDLFSLGAVLYECLAGTPAFSGKSVIEIGAQILHFNPLPPSTVNKRVHHELDRISLKALAKKPEARYQSATEMIMDLEAARASLSNDDGHRTQRLVVSKPSHSSALKSFSDSLRRPRLSIGFFALTFAFVVLGSWAILRWGRSPRPAPFQNLRMTKLTNSGKTIDAAISPDGKYLAEVLEEGGEQSLWLKQVGDPIASKQIVGPTSGQFEGLTFTPDGDNLYYVVWENNAHDVLYKIPVLGSSPQKLPVDLVSPISFSSDGKRMAFIRRSSNRGESALVVANADGSEQLVVAKRQEPLFFSEVGPAWSEDGNAIACSVLSSTGGFRSTVVEVALANGAEKQITSHAWRLVEKVAWLRNNQGLIITAADQPSSPFQIWHISYPDGATRRITNDLNSYVALSLSEDSSKLVTVQSDRLSSIWIAPKGGEDHAVQVTSGVSKHFGVFWAPQGRIVYSSIASGNPDIWSMNADGTDQKQLTTETHVDRDPAVSPDGRFIAFASDRAGRFNIWRIDVDGANLKQLTNGDDEQFPEFSPDGESIVYQGFMKGAPMLWRLRLDQDSPIQLTKSYSNWPTISPDGKSIACSYLDPDSGQWRLAVFPAEGGNPTESFNIPIPYLQHFVWQRIRWTSDGRALTYIDRRGGISNIWSQPFEGGPAKQLTDFKSGEIFSFAWSADGKQLACTRGSVVSDAVLINDLR